MIASSLYPVSQIQIWHLHYRISKLLTQPNEWWEAWLLIHFLTLPQMADDDSYFYVGTSTGDILKINTKSTLMSSFGPEKDKHSLVSGLCLPPLAWREQNPADNIVSIVS